MNKDTAKDYLPLVQALADGKTIQRVRSDGTSFGTEWDDIYSESQFDVNIPASCYRIKPEPKWIRLGLFKQGTIVVEDCESEKRCGKNPLFIRWLTDRIEYELPEGE